MPIVPLWHVIRRAVQDWWQDNCLRLAASLAYYAALSLAPLVLLLVSLVISAALAGAAALLHGPEQALLSRLLELAVSLLVLTCVFALLYMYVPDAEIGWRDVWPGALITAVLFTLGKTAIGVYLGHASVGSAYGAAGSLVGRVPTRCG
jgi:membrane protein